MTSLARTHALMGGAVDRASAYVSYASQAQVRRRRRFRFGGETYRYHAALYNRTWENERTVELPIVMRAISTRPGARVLEIGNVLAHYGVAGHTVVDKYEPAQGVLNQDVIDFHDDRGFDLIVSISTLEHIGFEEEIDDPGKPRRVADHLASLLAPGGTAIITFPLGYNPHLDALVANDPEMFSEMRGLRRVSADNRWVETAMADLWGARYGSPYPSANALVVATLAPRRS